MRVNGRSLTALCAASLLLSIANLAPAADDLRLVEAVKNRDMPAVRTLLAQKVDVNGKWPDGATALHWAAHWGDLDTVKLLLGVGATVNVANDHDVTPLSLACTNGNAAIADVLLKAGANPNVASPITGETPLMTAARTGSLDVIRLLLDRGADVNAKEAHQGQTAAMWAAAEGHLAAVRVLIERGADVRARSKAGYTPFLFAARTGDVELMRFLLSAGAKVNEEAADGTTALLVATVRRHTTLAGFLLEQGADPNKGPGFTPLHWAAGSWANYDNLTDDITRAEDQWSPLEGLRGPTKHEFAKLLLDHGADPNARTQRKSTPVTSSGGRSRRSLYGVGRARGGILAGATPFFIAARAGDEAAMRLLVSAGADPLLPNDQKTTALVVAAGVGVRGYSPVRERDALEAVKLCLELGHDVNAVNTSGDTALHGAAYRGLTGSDTIIQLLLSKGAELNAKNNYGWTPLAIAEGIYFGGSDSRSDKTAELFRKMGAEPTPADIERGGNVARERERARKAQESK